MANKIKVFAVLLLLSIIHPRTTLASSICQADSPTTLKSCLASLSTGTPQVIEVTKSFTCTAANPCGFQITGAINSKIFGTPGQNITITRSEIFTGPIFTINNSNHLTVSNLILQDNTTDPNCDGVSALCKAQIIFNNTTDSTIEQVDFYNSKAQAIRMYYSKNLTIKSCFITGTYLQGIWETMSGYQAEESLQDGLFIEGNTFTETYAEALFLSGKNIVVKNNLLTHNQWNPPWLIQGAQVNITGVDHLDFLGNTIANGSYYGGTTPGIETAPGRLNQNVLIKDNYIHDNTGWAIAGGIAADIKYVKKNFVMENNRIENNPVSILDLSGENDWIIRGCNGIDCPLSAYGTLSVAPSPCYLKTGSNACTVSIAWLSNFATNVLVKNGNITIGSGVSGKISLNSVTINPTTITLVSGNNTLDSKTIFATGSSDTAPGTIPIKTGDLNTDGKVDIFDYNLLVSKFGNPYTIFDYNNLVANYGK